MMPSELLREFFHHLGSTVTIEVTGTEPLRLDVSGEGTDAFIGKRGTTLRSIQFLYNLMLTKQLGEHDLVVIDIGGYRQRREELLIGMGAPAGRPRPRERQSHHTGSNAASRTTHHPHHPG